MSRIQLPLIILLGIFLITNACKEKKEMQSPKPLAYERIDIPNYEYISNESQHAIFNRSSLAEIELSSENNPDWFNINYPTFDAKIYCTYIPITPQKLNEITSESKRLAFSHVRKADNINESQYADSTNNVYGVIFIIDGDVASPCQFYLTNNNSHFFRGSLYYNTEVRSDSVIEITKTIEKDIREIISSFRWKKD